MLKKRKKVRDSPQQCVCPEAFQTPGKEMLSKEFQTCLESFQASVLEAASNYEKQLKQVIGEWIYNDNDINGFNNHSKKNKGSSSCRHSSTSSSNSCRYNKNKKINDNDNNDNSSSNTNKTSNKENTTNSNHVAANLLPAKVGISGPAPNNMHATVHVPLSDEVIPMPQTPPIVRPSSQQSLRSLADARCTSVTPILTDFDAVSDCEKLGSDSDCSLPSTCAGSKSLSYMVDDSKVNTARSYGVPTAWAATNRAPKTLFSASWPRNKTMASKFLKKSMTPAARQVAPLATPCMRRTNSDPNIKGTDAQNSHDASIMQTLTYTVTPPRSTKSSTVTPSRSKATLYSPLSKRHAEERAKSIPMLLKLTRSHHYEIFNTACIVLNAVFIACETEMRASVAKTSNKSIDTAQALYSIVLSNVFCGIFLVDLILRLWGEKWRFFRSLERGWNLFDIFVVLTSVIEVAVQWIEVIFASATTGTLVGQFSMLRIVRLLRAIRMTRAIRVIRFIRELRIMVNSVTGALKSLAWATVLMIIILLVFAVFFTDGAITYCLNHHGLQHPSNLELSEHFGSLPRSALTLYMSMSGGKDWADIMVLLNPLPWEYPCFFVLFVTFAILALLNVVTAVFVETAMSRSQNDREFVVQQEIEQKQEFVLLMQQVFEELDTNQSGALTLNEFEKHIDDEKIMAYLSTLQLDIGQIRTLFTLLDVDHTGGVDLDEFVSGCLRLRGTARSLDMAVIKYQTEWIIRKLDSVDKQLKENMNPDTTSGSDYVLDKVFRKTIG